MTETVEHSQSTHQDVDSDAHASCGSGTGAVPNMKNQHAFFLVGTDHLFLVHMGNCWMDCHRYQVILEVDIPSEARAKWKAARLKNPSEWFIVGNLEQDLMAIPELQLGRRDSFRAGIWMNFPSSEGSEHWPWANEPAVVDDFELKVKRVVYFRRLDFNQDYPRTASYIMFGKGKETFMNHVATKSPDYDHVLELSAPPAWLPTDLLELGVPVNFPSIPSTPGSSENGEGLYEFSPIGTGRHFVQYGGYGPRRQIEVSSNVFFGTFPFNPE